MIADFRGGSSIEYVSTVSSKRRCGVISFLVLDSCGCRWLGGVVCLSFLLKTTFGSWIVGSIGSIRTIFRFVGFAASVAFERVACTGVSLAFVVLSLLHLSRFIFRHSALKWPNSLKKKQYPCLVFWVLFSVSFFSGSGLDRSNFV